MRLRVILTAERADRNIRENQVANAQMKFTLEGWGFKAMPTIGRYHSTNEEGFCVECRDESEVTAVTSIATGFGQDCVLILRDEFGYLRACGKPHLNEHCVGRIHRYSQAPLSGDWTLLGGEFIQCK